MTVIGTEWFNKGEEAEVEHEIPGRETTYILKNGNVWYSSECKVKKETQHLGFPSIIIAQVNNSMAARPEMIYSYYRR